MVLAVILLAEIPPVVVVLQQILLMELITHLLMVQQ